MRLSNPNLPFDINELVQQLCAASRREEAASNVKLILEDYLQDPQWVTDGTPDYSDNDVILHEDDDVSIWHSRFDPGTRVPPHDHQIVATIGVYRGTECNEFYTRSPDGTLTKQREVILSPGDVLQIDPSAIHAVCCASDAPCYGIHVYLGRLTQVDRSLFDTATNTAMKFTDDNYRRLTSADDSD